MKKRIKLILISILVGLILLKLITETVYSSPYKSVKIRQIWCPDFSLYSAIGDGGSHTYNLIFTNRFGIPVKNFKSTKNGVQYHLANAISTQDSTVVYLEACWEGCFISRLKLDNWKINSTKNSSYTDANLEIKEFYKSRLKGQWNCNLDTIFIEGNKINYNGNVYPLTLYNDIYTERYFGDNARTILKPGLYSLDKNNLAISKYARNMEFINDYEFVLSTIDDKKMKFKKIK